MTKSRDTADSINRIDSSAADATAITVDSSENVLVGKTSSSFSVAGIGLMANDQIFATATSDNSLALNRLSTDGEIAKFYKDGTTAGSVSTYPGSFIQIESAGDKSGLLFGTSAYYPVKNGSLDNGNIDIGNGSNRFKDLYLGGGIQFDSRTNKLDDYEQGTWTAGISGTSTSGSISFNNTTGYYIKIGNLVHVRWYSSGSTVTTAPTGNTILTGLPFTPKLVSNGYSLFQYVHGDFFTSITTGGYFGIGQTYGYFVVQGGTATVTTAIGSPKYIMIAGTYEAT